MPKATWLHLSDWHHYPEGSFDRSIVAKALIKDIKNRAKISPQLEKIDCLIFSGDAAWSGQESQYEMAKTVFFEPIMREAGLESHQVFVVAGNHDLDRQRLKYVSKEFSEPLTDQKKGDVSELFEDDELLDSLRKPFRAFRDFAKADFQLDDADYASFRAIDIDDTHRVVLMGLNSALMCGRYENAKGQIDDYNQLTVGEPQVQKLLNQVAETDFKIAVMHHPFGWIYENERFHIQRDLLHGCNLILHGHEHAQRIEPRIDCPIIHAGASYSGSRTEEDAIHINSYNFAQYDFDTGKLTVYFRQWNDPDKEWVSALGKELKQGVYEITLAREGPSSDGETAPPSSDRVAEAPKAWQMIDSEFLDQHRTDFTDEQAVSFFDGSHPDWSVALAKDRVPRREMVDTIVDHYKKLSVSMRRVRVLKGAAGEGKSTILKQVVCELVDQRVFGKVLWYTLDDSDENIPASELKKRLIIRKKAILSLSALKPVRDTQGLLVVIDNADLVADGFFSMLKELHAQGRRDIQFLLCLRDIDWRRLFERDSSWTRLTDKFEKPFLLNGLSREDATRIVKTWIKFDKSILPDVLRDLYQERYIKDPNQAIERLLSEARLFEDAREGAFLGAMLVVRQGPESLKSIVRSVLAKAKYQNDSSSEILEKTFAYIAAFHAENKQILSVMVLAAALGCTSQQVYDMTAALGGEIRVKAGRYNVLVRHPEIARRVLEVLQEDHGEVYINKLYIALVRAAVLLLKEFEGQKDVPSWAENLQDDLNAWYFASDYFFTNKKNKELGLELARTAHKADSAQRYLVVKYAQLLRLFDTRDIERIKKAVDLLESHFETYHHPPKHRGFYTEWATCIGMAGPKGRSENYQHKYGDHRISLWLNGISLADGVDGALDLDRLQLALGGLIIACERLHNSYPSEASYSEGFAAAYELADRLRAAHEGSDKIRSKLITILEDSEHIALREDLGTLSNTSLSRVVGQLRGAVGRISSIPEVNKTMPEQIPRGEQIGFRELEETLTQMLR